MRKSQAEIEQQAKLIIDEFARALESVKDEEIEAGEPLAVMRTPTSEPEKEFKESMMRNFPRTKEGQPRMEKKGW